MRTQLDASPVLFSATNIITAVVVSVDHAVSGEGYTRFYDDTQGTFWRPLVYEADMNTPSGIARVRVGRPSCQDWLPPQKVRALEPGHIIWGIEVGGELRWMYCELPAVGCEP